MSEQKAIEYHKITDSDVARVRFLWQYCFKDSSEFIELYFKSCFKAENTLAAYQEGHLIAAAQLNPYVLNLRDNHVAVSYIVGVETAPEARGIGAAGGLLKALLEESIANGRYLTILIPFSGGFYAKYGWRYGYERLRYRIDTADLRLVGADYGRIELVDAMTSIAELDRVYRSFCAHRHGYAVRDEAHWQVLAADLKLSNGYCALLWDDAEPVGYVCYYFACEKIVVSEIAYSDYRAKATLLQYLYRHRSQFTKLEMCLAADDLSYQWLENKNAAFLEPYMMVRIADVQSFLEALAYQMDNISLKIKVNDELMENNNNIFSLEICQKKAKVTVLSTEKWDVALDIGDLSALAVGAVSADDLRDIGKIQVHDDDAYRVLSAIWPKENNYINEDY